MKRPLILALAFVVTAALPGCSSGPEDDNLKTTLKTDNESPEAQSAGAAPLINPDVPPPGGPAKGVKKP